MGEGRKEGGGDKRKRKLGGSFELVFLKSGMFFRLKCYKLLFFEQNKNKIFYLQFNFMCFTGLGVSPLKIEHPSS